MWAICDTLRLSLHVVYWHEAKLPERTGYFRSWGQTGCVIHLPATGALDRKPTVPCALGNVCVARLRQATA